MFPVDLAEACCRGLTPEMFGYMVWGTGGEAHEVCSQAISPRQRGVALLIFICSNIFNHDLYNLTFSVVVSDKHWGSFSRVGVYVDFHDIIICLWLLGDFLKESVSQTCLKYKKWFVFLGPKTEKKRFCSVASCYLWDSDPSGLVPEMMCIFFPPKVPLKAQD